MKTFQREMETTDKKGMTAEIFLLVCNAFAGRCLLCLTGKINFIFSRGIWDCVFICVCVVSRSNKEKFSTKLGLSCLLFTYSRTSIFYFFLIFLLYQKKDEKEIKSTSQPSIKYKIILIEENYSFMNWKIKSH